MEDQSQAGAGGVPAESAAPSGEPAAEGKHCVWCEEVIHLHADRCPHCAGFLPIAEGRAYGQHFFFFVACLAMFLGTFLPWEGAYYDSYGIRSIGGAFMMVFAGYGMVAAFFNIFHRRMIVWPAILAAGDAVFIGWKRVFQLLDSAAGQAWKFDSASIYTMKKSLADLFHLFGPGLYLVVIFSTLFWIVFVIGVVQGGREASARKEAEKAARAAKKRGA